MSLIEADAQATDMMQVLCLKGICAALSESDFSAIAGLDHLQELVLDCEQPPELENGAEEIKWGLQDFPEGMLHLTNMTHLTLTCHYGITELPETLSKLSKLEVSTFFHLHTLCSSEYLLLGYCIMRSRQGLASSHASTLGHQEACLLLILSLSA